MRRYVHHLGRVVGDYLSANFRLRLGASQAAWAQSGQQYERVRFALKVLFRIFLCLNRGFICDNFFAFLPQFRSGDRLAAYLIAACAETASDRVLCVYGMQVLVGRESDTLDRFAYAFRYEAFKRFGLCLGVPLIFCQGRANEGSAVWWGGHCRCRTRDAWCAAQVLGSADSGYCVFVVSGVRPLVGFAGCSILLFTVIQFRGREARSEARHRDRCYECRCERDGNGNGLAMGLPNGTAGRAGEGGCNTRRRQNHGRDAHRSLRYLLDNLMNARLFYLRSVFCTLRRRGDVVCRSAGNGGRPWRYGSVR